MRPERMFKVTLLVKNSERQHAIAALAEAQTLHVLNHKKQTVSETEIDIGTSLGDAEVLSDVLTKTRSLLSKLPHNREILPPPATLSDRIARVYELTEQYAAQEAVLQDIISEEESLAEQQALLEKLPDTDDPITTFFSSRKLATFLLEKPSGGTKNLHVALDPVIMHETKRSLLVSVPKKDNVPALAAAAGYSVVDLSPLRKVRGTKKEALRRIHERLVVLRHERLHEERAMYTISKHYAFLEESEDVLSVELMKAQAPLHFGTTEHVTLIRGFVPRSKMDAFKERMPNAVLTYKKAKDAPTTLHNPPVIRNFEELLKLYTLPKYNEIDPTRIMAVSFPVFFGFMLGDMGYGLILLALFGWLYYAKPKIRSFSEIIMVSAVSTIIFGALYGEAFGLETLFGYHLPYLIHRAAHIEQMLIIAMGFGVIHLNFGLVLGIINESHEGWFYAIVKKGSWILLQIAAVLFAGAYKLIPFNVHPLVAWTVLALAVFGVWYGERLQGLFELPMIFSHILSYTRLAAVGMASVSLALVVNDLGGGLVAKGGFAIVGGLLIIILGHTVNLCLGLLEPFLHSLRLHYAEFFMKFYTGGGTPYKPFGVPT